MAQEKVSEAAWNLTVAVREANQAIADSVVAAQERNVRFAQATFEDGVETLKNHAEETRDLMQELVERPQREQGVLQTVVNSAAGAQERNVKYAQSILQNEIELLKSHADGARKLMLVLGEQSLKQQEAFQALFRESWEAYMDLLNAPFSYYKQTLETAESIAERGFETAQRITHQGAEVVQKAAQAGRGATKSTAK